MLSHGTLSVTTPLSQHAQLKVIETRIAENLPKHVEYRIYNWRRLSSGRVVRGDGWGIGDLTIAIALAYAFWMSPTWFPRKDNELGWQGITCLIGLALLALLYIRSCTSAVLYQSVVPLPNLGLQLSTTRGISLPHLAHPSSPEKRFILCISTSHTFIPLSEISTVVINEGLRRWNVRYYLAVIKRHGVGVVVALDEVWAPVGVLREVYHGVREVLFDEYADPA